jgi:hypothetical protein
VRANGEGVIRRERPRTHQVFLTWGQEEHHTDLFKRLSRSARRVQQCTHELPPFRRSFRYWASTQATDGSSLWLRRRMPLGLRGHAAPGGFFGIVCARRGPLALLCRRRRRLQAQERGSKVLRCTCENGLALWRLMWCTYLRVACGSQHLGSNGRPRRYKEGC